MSTDKNCYFCLPPWILGCTHNQLLVENPESSEHLHNTSSSSSSSSRNGRDGRDARDYNGIIEDYHCPQCFKIGKTKKLTEYSVFECCFIPCCCKKDKNVAYQACRYCGFKIDSIQQTYCDNCSTLNPMSSSYCSSCGNGLRLDGVPVVNKQHADERLGEETFPGETSREYSSSSSSSSSGGDGRTRTTSGGTIVHAKKPDVKVSGSDSGLKKDEKKDDNDEVK